jgi:hypothetical protein
VTPRLAAVLLALASIGLGLAWRSAPGSRDRPDVFAWFAAQGLEERGEAVILGGAAGHRMQLLLDREARCSVGVTPLDSPEEVLDVLRRQLTPEAWAGARLWLGDLRPGAPTPLGLQAERAWLRLRDGAAPRPALVVAEPRCAHWLRLT